MFEEYVNAVWRTGTVAWGMLDITRFQRPLWRYKVGWWANIVLIGLYVYYAILFNKRSHTSRTDCTQKNVSNNNINEMHNFYTFSFLKGKNGLMILHTVYMCIDLKILISWLVFAKLLSVSCLWKPPPVIYFNFYTHKYIAVTQTCEQWRRDSGS
jgi:hypothetical protein